MSARRLSRRLSDVRSRLTAPGMRAPATLAAVAVALAAATGVLQWQAHSQRSLETARAESLKAARDTTAAVFTYTADSVDKDLAARTGRLTGAFRDEYTSLMTDQVIPNAREGNVTTVTEVPAAASVSVSATGAVALLFVDQTITRSQGGGPARPTKSTFGVRVTLERIGGRWLVSEFQPV